MRSPIRACTQAASPDGFHTDALALILRSFTSDSFRSGHLIHAYSFKCPRGKEDYELLIGLVCVVHEDEEPSSQASRRAGLSSCKGRVRAGSCAFRDQHLDPAPPQRKLRDMVTATSENLQTFSCLRRRGTISHFNRPLAPSTPFRTLPSFLPGSCELEDARRTRPLTVTIDATTGSGMYFSDT